MSRLLDLIGEPLWDVCPDDIQEWYREPKARPLSVTIMDAEGYPVTVHAGRAPCTADSVRGRAEALVKLLNGGEG